MHSISLDEWQTLKPAEIDFRDGLIPKFDKRTEEIVAKLSDKLELLELRNGLEVRATSWVGRVTVGELTITVRPKISGLPLINLLRYAYSLRDIDLLTTARHGASPEAFQDLIVEQLANEATELISRGLHRDYLRFDGELASPAGRIDFGRFVHNFSSAKSTIFCTHYHRSEAILLNQVLLAGLRLAGWLSTDNLLISRVNRLAQILEPGIPTLHLSKADIDNARHIIDRRSSAYGSALTLIELLVNGMGISLAESSERFELSGFLFDMNAFFQALISRFLRDELPEFSLQDEHRLKDVFEYDQANNPLRRRAVVPRPDFAVTVGGKVIELLDAKYRDLWETKLPRDMLYQLAVYALSKNAGSSRSTILYPTLASNAVDQVVLLKDPIYGHRCAEIVMRPVNLMEMEELIRPRQKVADRRNRHAYALRLAFGNESDAQREASLRVAS